MLPGLLAGICVGAGLLLAGRGLAPAPPPLVPALARLQRGDSVPRGTTSELLALRALRTLGPRAPSGSFAADLRIAGLDVRRHAVSKLLGAWLAATTVAAAGTAATPLGLAWPLVGLLALTHVL